MLILKIFMGVFIAGVILLVMYDNECKIQERRIVRELMEKNLEEEEV